MRSKRAEQFDEGLQLLFADLTNIIYIVGQGHECSDGRVELHILDIGRYLLNGLVKRSLQLLGLFVLRQHIRKSCHTLQETLAALDGVLVPRSCCAVITHEQYISTQGVCAVIFYDVQRVYHVTFGFTHLISVRSKDQSLNRTFCVRLRSVDYTDVIQEMMPETGIDHVSGNMLHTAVVPVNRHPVFQFLRICQAFVIVRINIAQEIPGRSCPLRHGIGLSSCIASTFRALAFYEGINLGQRGFSLNARLKVLYLRQTKRQLLIRNRNNTAVLAVNDRNRLTPVSLTVECPVFHLELYTCTANALLGQLFQHLLDGIFLIIISVQEFGVHHLTVSGISFLGDVSALDYLDNIDVECFCKIIVTLVVCRYCHDSSGTITHHYIVCNEDRDLLAVDRIDCLQALNLHTGLVFYQLGTLKLGLLRTLSTICLDSVHIGNTVCVFVNERMLRSHNHERHTEQGIRSGGIDLQLLIDAVYLEIYECTGRFTDPVYLLLFYISRIIYMIQTFQQFVCILGNS